MNMKPRMLLQVIELFNNIRSLDTSASVAQLDRVVGFEPVTRLNGINLLRRFILRKPTKPPLIQSRPYAFNLRRISRARTCGLVVTTDNKYTIK